MRGPGMEITTESEEACRKWRKAVKIRGFSLKKARLKENGTGGNRIRSCPPIFQQMNTCKMSVIQGHKILNMKNLNKWFNVTILATGCMTLISMQGISPKQPGLNEDHKTLAIGATAPRSSSGTRRRIRRTAAKRGSGRH